MPCVYHPLHRGNIQRLLPTAHRVLHLDRGERTAGNQYQALVLIVVHLLRLVVDVRQFRQMTAFRAHRYTNPFGRRNAPIRKGKRLPVHPTEEADKKRLRDVIDVDLPLAQILREGVDGRHILASASLAFGADYIVRELEEVQSEIVQGICTPHPLHHPVHILPGKLLVREAGDGIQHPLGNPLRLLLDGLGLDAKAPRQVTRTADHGGGDAPHPAVEVDADEDEVRSVPPLVGRYHDRLDGDHRCGVLFG